MLCDRVTRCQWVTSPAVWRCSVGGRRRVKYSQGTTSVSLASFSPSWKWDLVRSPKGCCLIPSSNRMWVYRGFVCEGVLRWAGSMRGSFGVKAWRGLCGRLFWGEGVVWEVVLGWGGCVGFWGEGGVWKVVLRWGLCGRLFWGKEVVWEVVLGWNGCVGWGGCFGVKGVVWEVV